MLLFYDYPNILNVYPVQFVTCLSCDYVVLVLCMYYQSKMCIKSVYCKKSNVKWEKERVICLKNIICVGFI